MNPESQGKPAFSAAGIPTSDRGVGAVSFVYGLVMIAFLVPMGAGMWADMSRHALQLGAMDVILIGSLILAPVPMLLAGIRLNMKGAATRANVWLLEIAAALLLFKALAVTLWIVQTLNHPKGALDGLAAIAMVPIWIMPSSIWGMILLRTARSLSRRLQGQTRAEAGTAD